MKLLIVDDEKSVREMTRLSINCVRSGIEQIFEAGNGQEALEILRFYRPEVTLLDMNMPGMSGTELMQQIAAEHIPTNLIVISGYDDFAYAKQALLHNAVNYILKPINIIELNDTLCSISKSHAAPSPAQPPYLDPPDLHVQNAYAEFSAALKGEAFSVIQIHVNDVENAVSQFGHDVELMALHVVALLQSQIQDQGKIVKNLNSSQMIYAFLRCPAAKGERETVGAFCASARQILSAQGLDCAFGIADQTHSLTGCHTALWHGNLHKAPYFYESDVQPLPIAAELTSLGMREGILCAQRMRHKTSALRVAKAAMRNLQEEEFISLCFLYGLSSELYKASSRQDAPPNVRMDYMRIFSTLDLNAIVDRMLEWIGTETVSARGDSATDDLTARVVEYILAHYQETITLDVLARTLFSSREHICKQFKKSMGGNLFAYLRNVRLERAFILLQRTNTSIADIAQACGFTDTSYFIKTFKQRYGCTPSSLRKGSE